MQKPDVNDRDVCLDIFGQQPFLKIYTQICLCFPMADDASPSAIVDILTNGLERFTASFPWVAGQVVNEGSNERNSGVSSIKPLERIPRLIVKDFRQDPTMLTMHNFRQAKFPMSMLDEDIICPCQTLPRPGSSDEFPVFLVQANFIAGGLLLSLVGEHAAMDMTGQGQIIHLLSKACRNEPFTAEEVSSGNRSRHDIIPIHDDFYEPGPELAHQIIKPDSHSASPPPLSISTWVYYAFPPASLVSLKSVAMETVPAGYVSTDDAVSALIWQSVVRARLARLDPESESTLARAIDIRPFLGIPETYPGLIQNMTYHTNTLRKLVEEPLGVVAARLRSALDPETSNLGHLSRALATYLTRTPDKSVFSFTATLNLSADVMLSSWAKLDCYSLDFSFGLGTPEAVRRPRFDPFASLMYLMPKTLDGEITAAICLADEDMERLKADEEFTRYAKYIG